MKKTKHWLQRLALKLNLEGFLSFGYRSSLPQRQLVVGYAAYSIIGMFLLSLPFASAEGIPWSDHLFTAISAISTTGLSTVDVASQYSFFGQLVILLLIQLGSLGYMTLSSFIMLGLTRHLGSAKNKLFTQQFSLPENMQHANMVRNIVGFTFGFELLGVLLLYPYFVVHNVPQPLWSAVFHTVSAFGTAGFSIYTDNLMAFRADVYVNTVIMFLCYMGAMGFILMTDLAKVLFRRSHKISFTTRIIVKITCALSLLSAAHLYYFEPSIQQYAPGERFMISLFQSVSAMTTAGFNTINLGCIVPISLLILSFTMYIGASPSGTGGGLKSTTLSALYAYTRSKLGWQKEVSLMNHIIPSYRVETAITTFIFYTFILFCGIYIMTLAESDSANVLKITFEASSALATTGLTSGILGDITLCSKFTLIVLMFIGRVGVITLGNALLLRSLAKPPHMRHDDLAV